MNSERTLLSFIESTGLDVFPFCLGGSVFGWNVDENSSFRVLDAYAQAGGNFIDTADSYSEWAPGNVGGESERIIGRWLASRKNRDRMVIATKVGRRTDLAGLSRDVITRGIEASLRRLGTDYIDLYYAHTDDAGTPLEESLTTFDSLVKAGKVRQLGASNISGPRLGEALRTSQRLGLASYAVVQPPYNALEREPFEGDLRPVCEEFGVACVPYFGLAQGFLTGKYRDAGTSVESVRRVAALAHGATARGRAILEPLEAIAAQYGTSMAAVALAWLIAQPQVAAPIASCRNPEQLAELLPAVDLSLTEADLKSLDIVVQ
ncbi:aldo/keto reductase [Streptomyces sp. NPDC006530]|uniref:aldo/keto reductase n=1 Tax=Streptomyces sp. NPDC006530 TaxID=3364750 RepID=UPI0036CC5A74